MDPTERGAQLAAAHEALGDIDTGDLRSDSLRMEPQNFEFSVDTNYDYGEANDAVDVGWRIVQPDLDELDLEELIELADHIGCGDVDEERPNEYDDTALEVAADDARKVVTEWIQEHEEEAGLVPMMNSAYPLAALDGSDQTKLMQAVIPLCVVEIDGDSYLALTGGGMDLSWEICEAFVLLGHLPPVHFAARLPGLAGDTLERRRATLAACLRSVELAESWAQNDTDRMAHQIVTMDQREADRIARNNPPQTVFVHGD